jgi:membrane protein implicated in regulation of membrane protease activity
MAARTYHRTLESVGTVNEGSDMDLGARFWFIFIGGAIACAISGALLFLVIGNAWARWGFLGMFLLLSAILLGSAWIVDRRTKRRYDSLSDAL